MKAAYIIFAFCAFFFSTADAVGEHEVFVNAMKKCHDDTGINETLIIELSTKVEATTDDHDTRCFFKCFVEEIQWMDKDTGKISGEGHYQDLDEMTIKSVKECEASVNDEDPCDKAYFFNRCILEKRMEQK